MAAPLKFLNLSDHLAVDRQPDAVVVGVGHGSTYSGKDSSGHALAADAIRTASLEDADLVEHWDFDLGGPLFDGGPVTCVDARDIQTAMYDNARNRARIEARIREILVTSAVPTMIGGDCSATIPFVSAFSNHGPVWILQIERDAPCERNRTYPTLHNPFVSSGRRKGRARECHAIYSTADSLRYRKPTAP